jgi:hypothetical protein
MKSPMLPSEVRLFHEILVWPIELQRKGHSSAAEWIKDASTWIRKSSLWTLVPDPCNRGTTDDKNLTYSEFVYFHTFIQKVLYPSPDDLNPATSILMRDDIKKVLVGLQGVDGVLTLDVDRVHLYLFRTQIAILVVEVSSKDGMDLDVALQLLDQFRAAYAPYHSKGSAGHCPVSVEWLNAHNVPVKDAAKADYHDEEAMYRPVFSPTQEAPRRPPVSAHWKWLLAPLTCDHGEFEWRQLEDHRIPTTAFLAFDNPFSLTRGDLMRICFCDEKGNSQDLPYAPAFLASFEEQYCYDRFWNPPPAQAQDRLGQILPQQELDWRHTRYMCCGYNFAVVTASRSSFLAGHFRHHYFQLGLIAHFHRASLLKYSRRLTEAASIPGVDDSSTNSIGSGSQANWQKLSEVRGEFANFVNQYWFREVSGHEQGKELFRFWSDRLGNQALLEQLGAEATAVDRILRSQYEKDQREAGDRREQAWRDAESARRQREAAQRDLESQREKEWRKTQNEQQEEIKKLQSSTDRLTKLLFWLSGLTLIVASLDMEVMRTWFAHIIEWSLGHDAQPNQLAPKYPEWTLLRYATIIGVAVGFLVLWGIYKLLFREAKNNHVTKEDTDASDQSGSH